MGSVGDAGGGGGGGGGCCADDGTDGIITYVSYFPCLKIIFE